MILGKSLADWGGFLLLFLLLMVTVLVVVMVLVKTFDKLSSSETNAVSLSSGAGDESFLIFWGRIGILEVFEGFWERTDDGVSVKEVVGCG